MSVFTKARRKFNKIAKFTYLKKGFKTNSTDLLVRKKLTRSRIIQLFIFGIAMGFSLNLVFNVSIYNAMDDFSSNSSFWNQNYYNPSSVGPETGCSYQAPNDYYEQLYTKQAQGFPDPGSDFPKIIAVLSQNPFLVGLVCGYILCKIIVRLGNPHRVRVRLYPFNIFV